MTKVEFDRFRDDLNARVAARHYSAEELDRRYLLDSGRIRRALEDLKAQGIVLTFDDLSRIAGAPRRAFDYWISDRGRRSCPYGSQVALIAEALGTNLSGITLPEPVEDDLVDEDLPAAVPARSRLGALREYWSILSWYRQHLGWRWHLPGFHLREFAHNGSSADYYAEIVIKPDVFPSLDPIEFVFAFRTPGMRGAKLLPVRRVDYGLIALRPDRHVHLVSTFQNQTARCRASREGTFRVWTWFGKEPCEFHVRSLTAFEIETHLEPRDRQPGNDPDVVTFVAASHHLQARSRP